MENYEGVKGNLKRIAINNFVGGIAWALGATVGIALIIFLLGFLSAHVNIIPFIGKFATDVTKFVLTNLKNSPR